MLLLISIGLLLISTGLKVVEAYSKETIYEIKYQSINTKNMSEANIVEKKEIEEQSNMLSLINWINDSNENITLQEVEIPKIEIKFVQFRFDLPSCFELREVSLNVNGEWVLNWNI